MKELRDLYQQMILDHNKNPKNFGELDGATNTAEGYNPLCGDHYWVDLKITNNDIEQIKFRGDGCAISKASASMMTTLLKGQTVTEAQDMFITFKEVTSGDFNKDISTLGTMSIFRGVGAFPNRVKCANLAWHTMKAALEKTGQVTTE